MGQQVGMENLRQQNDLARLKAAQGFTTERDAARRREELADMSARNAEAEAARMWGYEARMAEDMGNEVDTAMAGYAKQRQNFTPEGLKSYTDLAGKYGAIVKQRAKVRPAQYAELVGQFRQELANSRLDEHIQTPKPTVEQFEEETVEIPGKGLFAKDRSGSWRQIQKEDTKSTSERPASFEERYRSFDDFQKDYDATHEALWKRAKEAAASKVPTDSNALPEVPPPPSQDEVVKAMREKFDAYQQIQPQQQSQANAGGGREELFFKGSGVFADQLPANPRVLPPPPAAAPAGGKLMVTPITRPFDPEMVTPPPTPPQPGMPPVASPALQQQRLPGFVSGPHAGFDEVPQVWKEREHLESLGITPADVQAAAAMGATDPVRYAAFLAGVKRAHAQSEAENARLSQQEAEKRRTTLTPQQQQMAQHLPRPQSEAEAMALPSGSVFVWTDGTIRRRP